MPVDAGMVDAILGTFRNMARELKDKNNESEAAKQCFAVLAKMESLAQQMEDVASFSTKLSVDGLFTDFSNFYGQALASAAQSVSAESSSDQLMQNTLKAYEDALATLKAEPAHAHIVPVVQKVVDLGKSGLSYPMFLKTCEEQGVFLGMDSPHAGPTIDYDIYCYELMHLPVQVRMYKQMKTAYTQLCDRSAFGYPDPVEWEITRQKIEWQFAPDIARYSAIEDRWDRILDMINDWIDSFCKFAPFDSRWVSPGGGNSAAQTRKNIERTQECEPGRLLIREDIFKRYFNMTFVDIFEHESFITKREARLLWYSDQRIEFLKKVHAVMQPGKRPDDTLITEAEKMHEEGSTRRANMKTAEEMKPVPFPEFLTQSLKS
ncbi:MAG: hypothetical protein KDK41_13835 [Leptospiraceae bacterium]|nr:hypothetical protein [Leptospiraceae bacterium]